MGTSTKKNTIRKIQWVYISGAAFLVAMIVTALFIYFGQSIVGSDKSFIYFVVLVPLGICCAGILFNAMRSYAEAHGKSPHGRLSMSGPVVVFALVVCAGYWFYTHPPLEQKFNLIIYFRDVKNPGRDINDVRVTINHADREETHTIRSRKIIFVNAEPYKAISIMPDIENSNGYKMKDGMDFTTPDGRQTTMSVDLVRIVEVENKEKEIAKQISNLFNEYLNEAKDFKDYIQDSIRIDLSLKGEDSAAVQYIVNSIDSYSKAYQNLNSQKAGIMIDARELWGETDKYRRIEQLFSDFYRIHGMYFKTFDDKIRVFFTKENYTNEDRKKVRSAINEIYSNEEYFLIFEQSVTSVEQELLKD